MRQPRCKVAKIFAEKFHLHLHLHLHLQLVQVEDRVKFLLRAMTAATVSGHSLTPCTKVG